MIVSVTNSTIFWSTKKEYHQEILKVGGLAQLIK